MSYQGTQGIGTEYVVRCCQCLRESRVPKVERSKPSTGIVNKEAAGRFFILALGWKNRYDSSKWYCPDCAKELE